jgi:hypothetical protein
MMLDGREALSATVGTIILIAAVASFISLFVFGSSFYSGRMCGGINVPTVTMTSLQF